MPKKQNVEKGKEENIPSTQKRAVAPEIRVRIVGEMLNNVRDIKGKPRSKHNKILKDHIQSKSMIQRKLQRMIKINIL